MPQRNGMVNHHLLKRRPLLAGLMCLVGLALALALGSAAPLQADRDVSEAEMTAFLADTTVSLQPSAPRLNQGELLTLTIQVENVQRLYGVQYTLRFCTSTLEVVDADPDKPGVQIYPAQVFQGHNAMEAANAADNVSGVITYAVSLVGQNWFDGSGVLGRVTFAAVAEGVNPVRFGGDPGWTALSDPQANPITTTWRSALVTVGQYQLFLPLVKKGTAE